MVLTELVSKEAKVRPNPILITALADARREGPCRYDYFPKNKTLILTFFTYKGITGELDVNDSCKNAESAMEKLSKLPLDASMKTTREGAPIIIIKEISEDNASKIHFFLVRRSNKRLGYKSYSETKFNFGRKLNSILFEGDENSGTATLHIVDRKFLDPEVFKRIEEDHEISKKLGSSDDTSVIINISLRDVLRLIKMHKRYGFEFSENFDFCAEGFAKEARDAQIARFSGTSDGAWIVFQDPNMPEIYKNELLRRGLKVETVNSEEDEDQLLQFALRDWGVKSKIYQGITLPKAKLTQLLEVYDTIKKAFSLK